MNKLFSKVATLSVGLAMAIGVGVAVGSKEARVARADSVVTFTVGTDSGTTSLSKDGVSVTTTSGVFNRTDNYRVYANNSMTVSCSSGNITAMSFTISQNTFTANVGTWSNSSWTGSASSITLSASGGQVRFTTFSVTVSGGGPVVSYTITYDANGGSGSMSDSTNTVSACTFTAPEGKRFKEWNTAANGSGTAYAEGDSAASDLDLFAIWEDKPLAVTLDKIGTTLGRTANTTMATVDIADGSDSYTLNYLQCKKQNDAIFMTKSVGAFVSNQTEMPGDITSIEVFINSGASGSATYDIAFGTSEYTTATSGIGAVNITGGNSHEFVNSSVSGAKYFCLTLGAAYNGQVLKIVVNYETSVDPSKKNMTIYTSGNPADGATLLWSSTAGIHNFSAMEEETPVSGVTWSVSDTTVATIVASTGAMTTVKPGNVVVYAEAEGYNKASAAIEISKSWVEELKISGSMTKTSYTTAESWDASGLIVNASYHSGWEEDVTSSVEWSFNPATPADGVTSVVATATLGEDSVSSPAQSVTVSVAHAGTAADPFNVAEGIAKCVEIGNKSGGEGPWVTTGQISSIVQVLTTGYQNARFYITEDGKTTSPSIYAYDCKYLENAGFTEETAAEIVVGATVTITGNLLNYNNNTPEYARGCYLLDIQAPETGDVDVTFEPASTSFDIGATGTFTATSETSGVTFTWAVDDSSVLSVNASTGAYEAMGLGVARVTVTASAGGKEGFAFVDFVVNGGAGYYYSVADANTICSGVESGKTTAYEIYVEGYVKEFATSSKDGNPRAFDIMTLDEESSIMVYTNTDLYANFVEGLSLGDRIVVKGKLQNYNDKYEIVEPEKVGSNASAITFALNFISQTDAICEGYDGKSDNSEALEAIWSSLSSSYSALYDNQKSILMGAERDESGTAVERAVARYDYLVGKYGLDNFITGRTPVQFAYVGFGLNDVASDNNTMIIVVVIAAVSALAFTTLLVFKKKKQK